MEAIRAIDELGKLGTSKLVTGSVLYVYGDPVELRTIDPGYKVLSILRKTSKSEVRESGKDAPRFGRQRDSTRKGRWSWEINMKSLETGQRS